jgi:hypothetical protein
MAAIVQLRDIHLIIVFERSTKAMSGHVKEPPSYVPRSTRAPVGRCVTHISTTRGLNGR